MATYQDVYERYSSFYNGEKDLYDAGKRIPFRISKMIWNSVEPSFRLYDPKSSICVWYNTGRIAIAVPELGSALIYELQDKWGSVSYVYWQLFKPSEKDKYSWEVDFMSHRECVELNDEIEEEKAEQLFAPWE